jgi:hypothetical protein
LTNFNGARQTFGDAAADTAAGDGGVVAIDNGAPMPSYRDVIGA